MSALRINSQKILDNMSKIDDLMEKNGAKWSLVLKVLGGNKEVITALNKGIKLKCLHSVADSRLSNLEAFKTINPEITTMYIKPPLLKFAGRVVKNADISLNSSKKTIQALNREAKKINKVHKVIIMIELGELREGILRENTIEFYSKIFKLSHIEVIGLGTNLGCMYGIEPTYDKLMQLCLYKELIQAKFKKKLDLISGGSSITLPIMKDKSLPVGVNHYRIGEAVFIGTSPFDNKKFMNLSTNTFTFNAVVIELEKKDSVPDGVIGDAGVGHVVDDNEEAGQHYRAILDFGSIDVNADDLTPVDENVKFVGTTSDMTVYNIGKKKGELSVGDTIRFKPNYMGVARLMMSNFVTKEVR